MPPIADPSVLPATGRREQAKEQRRQALLTAARETLAANQFSMRKVADLAGVSEVTPYNLFGSKNGLLSALYRELVQTGEARLPATTTDPLVRFFTAIDGFHDNLAGQPDFYRAFFLARFESRGGHSYVAPADEGVDYWRRLLAAVVATGQIDPGRSGGALARHFINLLSGATQEWMDGAIDQRQWRALVAHGFALLALPLASAEAVVLLRRELEKAEADLPPP